MTLTQISVVEFEANPWSSDLGEPVLAEEYQGLPAEWLAVLDYVLAHPDLTYCWRCDEPVGFVLFEAGMRWVSTTLAQHDGGLVAILCDDCAPYVPEPVLPAVGRFRFPAAETAAMFREAITAQQPGVTGRAWRGEFAQRDVVAANVGTQWRPIHVPGVVVNVENGTVVLSDETAALYEVSVTAVRHARIVSDDMCELYGTTPKPALAVAQ